MVTSLWQSKNISNLQEQQFSFNTHNWAKIIYTSSCWNSYTADTTYIKHPPFNAFKNNESQYTHKI